MAIVIGDGAHAKDILFDHHGHTPMDCCIIVPHHAQWEDSGFRLNKWDMPIIAINDPWKRAEVAKTLGFDDADWCHTDTVIGPDCHWEYGTHINYGVTMTRTRIGHHVTIGPGVTICGDVVIGNRVLIGAGATICDRVTIGDDVTIGAGCVVLPESVVDDGAIVVGVPAKHVATGVHVK